MSFKLQYPAVDRGAKRVKHFNPDYMPTIRKKCFWIIEVKSAKNVVYPFDKNSIVQGLQYCIHPEIRAKYLVLTNGLYTCVYDSFSRIYGEGDIYEPLLEFSNADIDIKWNEIYQLLSAEKIKDFIEDDILSMYQKLVSSSLDKEYPKYMLGKIETISEKASEEINKHVTHLRIESTMQSFQCQQEECASLSPEALYSRMEMPLISGKGIGQHYTERSIALGHSEIEILNKIASDFDSQSLFRKENSIAALCTLFNYSLNPSIKENILSLLRTIKDSELPLVNQVECAFIRIRRKMLVIMVYPELREEIDRELTVMPEVVRYINPPTVLSETYPDELIIYMGIRLSIVNLGNQELVKLFEKLMQVEKLLDEQYELIRPDLGSDERELCGGLEINGLYHKAAFNNIMKNVLGKNYSFVNSHTT
jgi:hypothetical protein